MCSMTDNPAVGRRLQDNCFSIGLAVLFVALVIRNSGLYPVVMADELAYSTFSRLQPWSASLFANYLYLAVYCSTSLFGEGFLVVTRVLNVMFLIAAAPLIYLITRRVASKGIASAIALLAVAGPINSYSAYYMPESMYFFSFWLMTWFLLRLDNSAGLRAWCLAGVIWSLASLVKTHALLLAPAIVTYVLYVARNKERKWPILAFRNAVALLVSAVVTKMLVGYLLVGTSGLTFFGPCYTSIAGDSASQLKNIGGLFALPAENLRGHALAICLMFGVPIGIAIIGAFRSVFTKAETRPDHKIAFYSVAVLADLVILAGLYTASTPFLGPNETVARLHMRYYDFAFPLLLIIAASQLSLQSIAIPRGWRVFVALPIGVAIIYATCTRMNPYELSFIDCPELTGFEATLLRYTYSAACRS
jgi:phosphoglycerol transferase